MKKSIVMCTFNGEKFIREQLESIINQNVNIDEILISDDCSKDNTRNILTDYAKRFPNIKLIFNKENKGFIKNFFDTINIATGDLIFLCDQDDIWLQGRVKSIENIFEKNKDMLCLNTGYNLVDEKGEKLKNKLAEHKLCLKKLNKLTFKGFLKSPRYPGMSMTIRKELRDSMSMIDYNLISSHDWYINQFASYYNGNYFYNKKLTLYRQHTKNTVGVVNNLEPDYLLNQRLKRICSFQKAHRSLMEIYKDNIEVNKYAKNLLVLDKKRKKYIENGYFTKLLFLFFLNHKKISIRCILGDALCILKQKK